MNKLLWSSFGYYKGYDGLILNYKFIPKFLITASRLTELENKLNKGSDKFRFSISDKGIILSVLMETEDVTVNSLQKKEKYLQLILIG